MELRLEVFQRAAALIAARLSTFVSMAPESANTMDLRPPMSINSKAGRFKTVVNFTEENNPAELIFEAASKGVS